MYRGHSGGAEHLARIHGTEEDKVNCPFYFKIGACRHGDKCSRQHHRPPFSETIIIKHMWNNPMCAVVSAGGNLNLVDRTKLQENLNEFYEEIFEELQKFGKIEDIQVCENLGDHMVGNVYVKYYDEEDAEKAKDSLHGRYYAGRPLHVEYSPVTDFKEARCRQFDEGTCSRGPYCNFMHVCEPSRDLRKYLDQEYGFKGGKMKGTGGMDNLRSTGGRDRDRSDRDRDRDRDRQGSRNRDRRDRRGGSYDREKSGRRERSRSRSRDGDRRSHRDRNDSRDR